MNASVTRMRAQSQLNEFQKHTFIHTVGADARQEGGEGYYKRWVI